MKISRIIEEDTRSGLAIALCTNRRYAMVEKFLDGRTRLVYSSRYLGIVQTAFRKALGRNS